MLIDYHLHNHFSPDSHNKTEELIQKEQELGISHICITNHAEWFEEGENGRFQKKEAFDRFTKIKEEIEALRLKFANINIGFGVEIQYMEKPMDDQAEFVDKMDFDFILGSVHLIDGILIAGGGSEAEVFDKMTENEAYGKYFEDVLKLVEWGFIDAVAHFDICKKFGHKFYGPFQPQKHKPIILKILQAMKNRGMAMELNTGSMHKNCHELFPHPDILKWCLDTGIENYTLGSDAHEPDQVGRHLEEALEIAKEVGIKTLSTYRKRDPKRHEI